MPWCFVMSAKPDPNPSSVATVVRVRDLGRDLQRIALELAEMGDSPSSRLALKAALRAMSFKPPKA